jgi:hypothetical protein
VDLLDSEDPAYNRHPSSTVHVTIIIYNNTHHFVSGGGPLVGWITHCKHVFVVSKSFPPTNEMESAFVIHLDE